MEARALVVTERQPGLLQAVRNLFLEYSRLLLQVAECDLTAFQDFQDELRELPGRYGEERGGVLILLAHISTPALLTEAAACRCLGTVQVPRAAAADTFVGCVALKRLSMPSTGEMKRLFVRDAFRRQGLARWLSQLVVDVARGTGVERLCLDTLERLPAAVALYTDMGFRRVPAYVFNPLPDAVYMELVLSSPRAPAEAAGAAGGAATEAMAAR